MRELQIGVRYRFPFDLLADEMQLRVVKSLFAEDRGEADGWRHHVRGVGLLQREGLWQVALWFTGSGENFLASDAMALAGVTDQIVYLEEGDLVDVQLGKYWIADADPYELRTVLETVRDALASEGLDVTERQPRRIPALVGAVAARADEFVQGRGRYVQALHVLGELKDTIACDISAARADLGYEPPTSLLEGMRVSVRWCLDNGESL